MKRIFITTALVLFSTLITLSQNHYYWSGGKKLYLKESTTKYIIESSYNDVLAMDKLSRSENVTQVGNLKGKLKLVFTSNYTLDKVKKIDGVTKAMPTYELEESPFYLTGEILLQPKQGRNIDEILKSINNRATLIKQTPYNTFVLATDDWDKLFDYANKIYESGMVEYCHPNFITPTEKHQINDPKYTEQYYLNNTGQFGGTSGIDINAPEAWGITTGLCMIRVAVIDDGVENHEDMNGRVLQGFTPQTSAQNPNTNGAPNANSPSGYPFGHGECCAGIIAASHNSIGIRGISPNVNIIPINIFNDWFMDTYYDIYGNPHQFVNYREDAQDHAAAIDFAWDNAAADVISNSWGYTNPNATSDAVIAAIGRARTQGRLRNGTRLGCVVVFSSGNDVSPYNNLTVRFPGNVDGVITVGAIDKNGNIHDYSCRGASMDLVAPSGGSSGDVRTIDREGDNGFVSGNYYDSFNGTSAACPQVSGVAALMLSVRPDLTEAQVRTTLQQTATDMGNSGFDNTYGHGRLNALAAVQTVYPYLVTGSNVCTSGTTFTVNQVPQGYFVTWTCSSNITFDNQPGNPKVFTAIGSGSGTITAMITSPNCGAIVLPTRTVVVGGPPSNVVTNSFSNLLDMGYSNYYKILPASGTYAYEGTLTASAEGANSDSWSYVSGITGKNIAYWSASGNTVDVGAKTNNAGEVLMYTATNGCGSSSAYYTFFTGNTGPPPPPPLIITPNPAATQAEVSIPDNPTNAEVQTTLAIQSTYTVSVISSNGLSVYSTTASDKNVTIPTSNLQNGIYIVRVSDGTTVFQGNLIVNH